jgi:hypothetical protein
MGELEGVFSFTCTGRAVFARLTVVLSVQTVGSTCSSVRGKQKYSLGGSRIWTLVGAIHLAPAEVLEFQGPQGKFTEWRFPQE